MSEEQTDGAVLHDAVDGRISEFMDEYIIVGKKAGLRQKMLVSTIKNKDGFLSGIFKQCMLWAHHSENLKEDKKYE